MPEGRPVFVICEDELSRVIIERLIRNYRPQLHIDRTIVTGGNGRLLNDIPKYVAACQSGIPHIVLTDLDKAICAPQLLANHEVPSLPGKLLFRVAVKEVESWLLADREGLASLLNVPVSRITMLPDNCIDPKEEILSITRRSKSARLKRDMLPVSGSSANIGPLYNDILGGFANASWNIAAATRKSPSLAKFLLRLGSF